MYVSLCAEDNIRGPPASWTERLLDEGTDSLFPLSLDFYFNSYGLNRRGSCKGFVFGCSYDTQRVARPFTASFIQRVCSAPSERLCILLLQTPVRLRLC